MKKIFLVTVTAFLLTGCALEALSGRITGKGLEVKYEILDQRYVERKQYYVVLEGRYKVIVSAITYERFSVGQQISFPFPETK